MTDHIFLFKTDLSSISLIADHAQWLEDWLHRIEPELEAGNVSSSLGLQGLMSELVLFGEVKYDWLAIFEDYLTDDDGTPLAYSEIYGSRLFKFDNQWRQSPIHAVHTRWWIEKIFQRLTSEETLFADFIKRHIQPNGWIYNTAVSPTGFRTRMKSEYLMSFAMGVEILDFHGLLTDYREVFETTLSSEPLRPFLSSEYFRGVALETLNALNLAPAGLEQVVKQCEAGAGYCDFTPEEKRDDYMGTAKRVERDQPVHSPLAALHARRLALLCGAATLSDVSTRLTQFAQHIQRQPLDIPAFRIRDLVDIPFGTGISPLEVIAASVIVNEYQSL